MMRFQLRHAAAALLIAAGSGGAAEAQTVVAQPAETVITRPLQLTPAQRTTIYRTIIPRSHGRRPIVRERVVTQSVRTPTVREQVVVPAPVAPTVGERVVVENPAYPAYVETPEGYVAEDYVAPPPAYMPAPQVAVPTYTYDVGTQVPASTRLLPLPQRVVAGYPSLRPYRYMVFNDRVLLVDPATSTIVADVTQ